MQSLSERRAAGSRSITIPDAAATGPAMYQVTVDYTCNIIHRLGWPITVTSPPIHFQITERPIILQTRDFRKCGRRPAQSRP
jgi:hypothetical protein